MIRFTPDEQKQHRAELVAALRSGKYRQIESALSRNGGFCCLGVACDLIPDGRWEGEGYATFHDPEERKANLTLTPYVMAYYGFRGDNGGYYGGYSHSLSNHNDRGWTFDQIADLIESEPEGMFEK